MKICFYCDSVFSYGGVQRVLTTVAKGLSVHHDITILTLDDPLAEDHTLYNTGDAGITFEYLAFERPSLREYLPAKLYSFLYKWFLPQTGFTSRLYAKSSFPSVQRKRLVSVINRNDYHAVVGVHAFRSLDLTGISGQIKPAIIAWLHTSYDGLFRTPGLYLWERKRHFRYAMRLADDIIVLTNSDKQMFAKEMKLGTTAIYNPLNTLPAYRFRQRSKKFLAVGRLSYLTKGFDILIKAFAIYAGKDREWLLDIVGEGPEEAALHKLIKELGLVNRIFIHPFTTDIQKYYSTAGIFVLSSRWEGFGLVMVEAMSHGLPVIASDLPVVREILGDCDNGLMYRNGSVSELSMRMLEMTERCDLKAMGRESYRIAQRFSPAPILSQWDELLCRTNESAR